MTIGERIKRHRIEKNISQQDFAKKLGILKQTLYKYEQNIVTNIPSNIIEESAKILEISPAFLMGWSDNSSDPVTCDYSYFENIVLSLGYEIWDDNDPTNYAIKYNSRFNWDDLNPSDTITICKRDYKDEFVYEKSFTMDEISKVSNDYNKLSKSYIKQFLSGNNPLNDVSDFEYNIIAAYRSADPGIRDSVLKLLDVKKQEVTE